MELPALLPADAKARSFFACLVALLLATALYVGFTMAAWARTPLGQRPQGDAAAYLADAEKLYQGELTHEPFFRAPAYLAILATLREAGVPGDRLAGAARGLNGFAHVASTALIMAIALRFWRRKGALLAGGLWGFYPPAVFLALQPTPTTLALLAWLGGAAAAFGTIWQSPIWQGGRMSRRHAWAYPFTAAVAFVLAAALNASLWPTALAWPAAAIFLGRDMRARRLLAASAGFGAVVAGIVGLQVIWGGSPQPLAGEDLYHLARALEITQPWNAPLPAVEFSASDPGTDYLELESTLSYQFITKQPVSGHAVLAGFWRRAAIHNVTTYPAHSVLRAARKASQFFAEPNFSAEADYARAREELPLLNYNPLNWGVLLVLGFLGLALGWRSPAMGLAVLLAGLVAVGGVIWYPTTDVRAPVAVLLTLFAGALPGAPWQWWKKGKFLLLAALLVALALAWWPRRNSPADALAARDRRERALACAELGRMDDALSELTRSEQAAPLSILEREMAATWRFQELLDRLPQPPANALLEKQLLDNGELVRQSPASQFRCGVCLWLLGRTDGALYYWDNLANDQGAWGAAARKALADSGHETPAQAQRRTAWEIGGGPKPDLALAPFFAFMRAPTGNIPPGK